MPSLHSRLVLLLLTRWRIDRGGRWDKAPDVTWLNTRYTGKREEKPWHTHPGTCRESLPGLLSAQMLDWGGADSQCVQLCMDIYICVYDSDRSEGYLVMTAADTMGPFSIYPYSAVCLFISSSFLLPPPFSPVFLKSAPTLYSYSFLFNISHLAWLC